MMNNIQEQLSHLDQLKAQYGALPVLDESTEQHFNRHIMTDMTYHSNAIEGSTLTLDETKLILNNQITVSGKSLVEHQEATNHAEAMRYIQTLSRKAPYILSEAEILSIHERLLAGINYSWAGIYRQQPVYIKKQSGHIHEFCDWTEIPRQIIALLQWLRESTLHPVLLAAELHYRFVSIHPFIDGNGRTARLLMNVVLLQNGFPLTTIRVQHRQDYLEAIDVAKQSGDMNPFYQLHLDALLESLELNIKTHQENIIWK